MTATKRKNEQVTGAAPASGDEEIPETSPDGTVLANLPPDIEQIDFSNAEFMEQAHERYGAMRARCPVSHVVFTNVAAAAEAPLMNRPLWLVTGYEEGSRALLDRELTVDASAVMAAEQLAQLGTPPEEFRPLQRNILTVDPPEHTRLRKLVQPSFTAGAIEKLRPHIQRITDELLDELEGAAAGRGERAPERTMELIAQFAYPLPMTVICELLGIPMEEREQTRRWTGSLLKAPTSEGMEEIRHAIGELITYLRELFRRKREQPDEGLISQLLEVEVEGDRLAEDEVLAMVFILFTAGHVTTVNLIANGVFALLTHPEQAALLRSEPNLVANAVEEVLRYYGPVEMTVARFAREEVELSGQMIGKGEPLLVALAAADRDPARFVDPQKFDITREDANRHIAFGKGVHACLGAPLARLEGQIALETLFRRFPLLRLGAPREEITWAPGFFRALTGLPLRF